MSSSVKNGLVVDGEGNKTWYKNGEFHREDGPAIEYEDGSKEWWLNGLRHREDGPAIEYPDVVKEWLKNGIRHREDGPAVEREDGSKAWYREGTYLGDENKGFWKLWETLDEDQKGNPNLLRWIP